MCIDLWQHLFILTWPCTGDRTSDSNFYLCIKQFQDSSVSQLHIPMLLSRGSPSALGRKYCYSWILYHIIIFHLLCLFNNSSITSQMSPRMFTKIAGILYAATLSLLPYRHIQCMTKKINWGGRYRLRPSSLHNPHPAHTAFFSLLMGDFWSAHSLH